MSREEAAKMLVVAWVKDWALGVLGQTIGGKDYTAEKLHKAFPFMSDNAWLYCARGAGISTRRYMADYLKRSNDRLWDAKDNPSRLALAGLIAKDVAVSGTVASKEAADMRKAKKELSRVEQTNAIAMQMQRRSQRGAWDVCKA